MHSVWTSCRIEQPCIVLPCLARPEKGCQLPKHRRKAPERSSHSFCVDTGYVWDVFPRISRSTHWINIDDFMEPRAIKNLDSTHRPYGDGFIPRADGLLLRYTSFNCWCWFFFASKQPKTCRKWGLLQPLFVCVFWCRCVLFLTKSTRGDRFCGSMAVVASPLKLCTKGAEDDPDTGGKRRTEQEEGPTRRKASDVAFFFNCFVYLNYLVNLWKLLCTCLPSIKTTGNI